MTVPDQPGANDPTGTPAPPDQAGYAAPAYGDPAQGAYQAYPDPNQGAYQAPQGGYNQEAYAQPGYAQPGYAQPAYGQPAYGQPGYAPGYPPDPNAKSKLAAGLLSIFLGGFGVGNFYLGRTGPAVAQLLITVLSLGFLSPVSGIWGLIEGIMILAAQPGTKWSFDARGVPLNQ
jgi:TM2 domain-containing membrane protein YozV